MTTPLKANIYNSGTAAVLQFDTTEVNGLCILDQSNVPMLQTQIRFRGEHKIPYIKNYNVGCVVLSIDYMKTNNINYDCLQDVLNWMKENYANVIEQTHHRLSKLDNRLCALQKAPSANHKHNEARIYFNYFNNVLWDMYIAETEKHCCGCDVTGYKKLEDGNYIPFKCKKCRSCKFISPDNVQLYGTHVTRYTDFDDNMKKL